MRTLNGIIEKLIVSADGIRIFAGALGDSNKPALVFSHSSTLSSSNFDDLFAKPENSRDFFLVSIHSMAVSGLSNKKRTGSRFAPISGAKGKRANSEPKKVIHQKSTRTTMQL